MTELHEHLPLEERPIEALEALLAELEKVEAKLAHLETDYPHLIDRPNDGQAGQEEYRAWQDMHGSLFPNRFRMASVKKAIASKK